MHVTGKVKDIHFGLDGRLVVSFELNEKDKALEELDSIKDLDRLTIDAVKYRHKRSLNANAYFWQLCDKIAKALNSDKDTIYGIQLSRYGVFIDVGVVREALRTLQESFRYVEVLREITCDTERGEAPGYAVRCYFGSHDYNSKEMSDLINGTVQDAKELGIETLTPAEISSMMEAMKDYERRHGNGV